MKPEQITLSPEISMLAVLNKEYLLAAILVELRELNQNFTSYMLMPNPDIKPAPGYDHKEDLKLDTEAFLKDSPAPVVDAVTDFKIRNPEVFQQGVNHPVTVDEPIPPGYSKGPWIDANGSDDVPVRMGSLIEVEYRCGDLKIGKAGESDGLESAYWKHNDSPCFLDIMRYRTVTEIHGTATPAPEPSYSEQAQAPAAAPESEGWIEHKSATSSLAPVPAGTKIDIVQRDGTECTITVVAGESCLWRNEDGLNHAKDIMKYRMHK